MAKKPGINSQVLGEYVRARRVAAGLGVRALARAAGVDPTWISRLEHGEYVKPDPRSLARVAGTLEVEVSDLYVAAGYQPGTQLPGFTPYLRAKYGLPDEAVAQLAAHFELLAEKYRREARGGGHGRDDR